MSSFFELLHCYSECDMLIIFTSSKSANELIFFQTPGQYENARSAAGIPNLGHLGFE
jgi:hypothetical protein